MGWFPFGIAAKAGFGSDAGAAPKAAKRPAKCEKSYD
jgi:hypothetical protein